MQILNDQQITQKITRLAYEVIEQNLAHEKVFVIGINRNGLRLATLLHQQLEVIRPSQQFHLHQVTLSPRDPIGEDIHLDMEVARLSGQAVVLVDDVANTGRTLFFACEPLMQVLVKRLQIAVLIDRKHKSYPIKVNYLGMSLATTLSDNILVDLSTEGAFEARLE